MVVYLLITLGIVFISFLSGLVVTSAFKLDFKKYFHFLAPVGYVSLLGILYPGYLLGTLFIDNTIYRGYFYIAYTAIIIFIILILSLLGIKKIIAYFKNLKNHIPEIIMAIVLIIIMIVIFMFTQYNYRLDDINYYGIYIPDRVFRDSVFDVVYDCQSFYIFYSIILKAFEFVSSTLNVANYLSIGFVFNVPGFVDIIMVSLFTVSLFSYFKKKTDNKIIPYVILLSIVFMLYTDYWMMHYLHTTGILRMLPISLIILFISYYQEDKNINTILIGLMFAGLIGINSSGFFISAVILYGYLIYAGINKKNGYIRDLMIWALIPLTYGFAYLNDNGMFIIYYLLIVAYILMIFVCIFKLDKYIEYALNKFYLCHILMVIVPIGLTVLTYVFNIPSIEQLNAIGGRHFFDNINNFDMVPDLFNTKIQFVIFNILFWVLLIVAMIKNYKMKNFAISLTFITLLTFFNPFVYRFVAVFITQSAYNRINNVFYNPVVIGIIVCYLLSDKKIFKYMTLYFIVVMAVAKVVFLDTRYFAKDLSDHNFMYHVSQNELNIIQAVESQYISTLEDTENLEAEKAKNPFLEDGTLRLASQIYGAQLFTYTESMNMLEDRFSYVMLDTEEFERVFVRRIPGYELPEANYNHACSLAFDKKIDYVILDAQYNWELQTGLWPCSYEVLTEMDKGNYRVLKMDYEYWEYNINQGSTIE